MPTHGVGKRQGQTPYPSSKTPDPSSPPIPPKSKAAGLAARGKNKGKKQKG